MFSDAAKLARPIIESGDHAEHRQAQRLAYRAAAASRRDRNHARDGRERAPTDQRRGGPFTVWAVLHEDVYETKHGDGFFLHIHGLALNSEDAHRLMQRNVLLRSDQPQNQILRWPSCMFCTITTLELAARRASPFVSRFMKGVSSTPNLVQEIFFLSLRPNCPTCA